MRFPLVKHIYLKELKESLRDRRTLFMMVGVPLLIYPLIMIGMSRLQENQQAVQAAKTSRVAVWGELPAGLAQALGAEEKVEILPAHGITERVRAGLESGEFQPPPLPPRNNPDAPADPPPLPQTPWLKDAQDLVLKRDVDAIVVAWPGLDQDLASGRMGRLSILFDSVRPDSQKATARLSYVIGKYRDDLLTAREKERGLAHGFTSALAVSTQNVAPEKRQSGIILGTILPYVLIMFSVMSGFYAAIDVTAGEKERGTMQTLLCAPLEALEIITGKFMAVWTISVLATIINILSLSMTFSRIKLIPGTAGDIPTSSYFIAFLMLVPISLMMNALFLAVGAFAKDFKDGQNYLTPVLMSMLIPLSATMVPGIEMNNYLAFMPVVNIALLIKGVFVNEWQAETLFLTLLSSFIYAGLALLLAARVFDRNNVLLGGREGLRGIFDFSRVPGDRPTPGVSFFAFALVLVLAFYGSISLLKYGIITMLAVTQYGFFLAPIVLFIYLKGYNWKDVLSLRPLSLRGALGAVLIGVSGWTIGGGLLVRLLPPPESLTKSLSKILLLDDKPVGDWQIWLIIAITPALCEETVFRGLILSGFRRMGKWPAILLTGLLFGLAHSSIYRLLPTFFLGVVFAYAVWKTGSIYAGIIAHALNNGLMAMLARSKDLVQKFGLAGQQYMPWEIVAAGAVVFVIGVLLISGMKEPEHASPPDLQPLPSGAST